MNAPRSLIGSQANPLAGTITVPGDKSVSHRALMLSALAVGESTIHGLLTSEDVLATANALSALGAEIIPGRDEAPWQVWGRGISGLAEPDAILDLGNSGTGARLLSGILAGHPFTSIITGDASLVSRPMARVIDPLRRMGAEFQCRDGARLPMTIKGCQTLRPIIETPAVASAQVKSAILLAGLHAPGKTTVMEARQTRDHTERMMRSFGAEVSVEETPDGVAATVTGQPELEATEIRVPSDISSAAFPLVAALLVPGSDVTCEHVGINPLRAGILECLREMGADLVVNEVPGSAEGGEPLAHIQARASTLSGIDVPAVRAPSMIDEYPILAIAAACAQGTTIFNGVAELRVKESDRLAAIATGLAACGVSIEESEDRLVIHGLGGAPAGGATIAAQLDHRIAMAFLVLGQISQSPITIDDGSTVASSFPTFVPLMQGLGATLQPGTAGE